MNEKHDKEEDRVTYDKQNELRDDLEGNFNSEIFENEDTSDIDEKDSEVDFNGNNESELDTSVKIKEFSEQITNEEEIDNELIEEAVNENQMGEIKEDLHSIHKNLIEGALYAAGRPLDIEELATKLEISKKEGEDLVNQLAYEYLDRSSALVIAQVGERYQMQLRPEYTETISKFTKGGAIAERYLRTLTIIALKQPILKSTVVKIRGTGAYEHVKYLLDNDLISAEKKGRSHELTTTDKYADMFGLPKNREELKRTMISQLGLNNKDE